MLSITVEVNKKCQVLLVENKDICITTCSKFANFLSSDKLKKNIAQLEKAEELVMERI